MDEKNIKNIIKKIDEFFNDVDPLGLGVIQGEYSQISLKIFKLAKEKKGMISNEDVQKIFHEEFIGLEDNISATDSTKVIDFVKDLLKDL